MKSLHSVFGSLFVLTSAVLLSGCLGSGSDSGNGINSDVYSGLFVDSLVTGLDYQTPSTSGVTDNGVFTYRDGESVTWSLGPKCILGTTAGKAVVTPKDFDNMINIAVLLQSLDDDSDPENGIVITDAVKAKLQGTDPADPQSQCTLIKDIYNPDSQTIIKEAMALKTKPSTELVDQVKANDHLARFTSYIALNELALGQYTGPFWGTLADNPSFGYNFPYGDEWRSYTDAQGTVHWLNLPYYRAGIDIRPIDDAIDHDPVYSLTSGIVVKIDPEKGAIYIKPDHNEGVLIYMYLFSIDVNITVNVQVSRGQLIGTMGNTGIEGVANDTDQQRLHIEWLTEDRWNERNEPINADDCDTTDCKERNGSTRHGTEWILAITNNPIYLKYFPDGAIPSLVGYTWSMLVQAPGSDNTVVESNERLTFIDDTHVIHYSDPKLIHQQDYYGECVLEMNFGYNATYAITDNQLTLTYTENYPRETESCRDGHQLLSRRIYKGNTKKWDLAFGPQFALGNNIDDVAVLKLLQLNTIDTCHFGLYGSSICYIRDRPFYFMGTNP